MGFLKPKAPKPPPPLPVGPSAEEIRADEQAKIKAENLKALKEQEEKRQTLRSRLLATDEDDDAEIKRKRLFGQ